MNISDIQLLFDYNDWANELMLSKAAELSPEQLTQPTSFSYGNLLETLIHTLDAEYVWRTICQNNKFMGRLVDKVTISTLEALTAQWKQEEQVMRAYLNGLTDADMDGIVRYEVPEGVRERVLWHCLVHVVNHGTQHRSESAAMLTDFGHSPGDIDFSIYMNTRA